MTEENTSSKLQCSWVFWYTHRPPGQKPSSNYLDQMKTVATFSTVDDFWRTYQHIKRPSSVPVISDYHLFKEGIKPAWEDESNCKGGKWIIRLKKGLSDRMWENLLLALIGDQFRVGDEICGAVLSLRTSEDIISIWNANADSKYLNKIRETMRVVLNLPKDVVMEYKPHSEALAVISHQQQGAEGQVVR